MAFPMSLCPDNKRGLNFYFLKKNQNSTMLDKGSVAVYSTSSGCPSDIVHDKPPKFHAYLRAPSFCTSEVSIVGGFLGSKSQGRSTSNPSVCDFIPKVLACLKKCEFSSVPSPPKKKCAKEYNLASLAIFDSIHFPSVIEEQSSGSKQSYAEVAKAATWKPSRPDNCHMQKDLTDCSAKKESRHRRRPVPGDQKSSRRKSSRRDRGNNTSPRKSDVLCLPLPSPSAETQPQDLKDLRLCQQEKHHSQHRTTDSNKNFRRSDRHTKYPSNSDRRDHLQSKNSEGGNHPKRRSNYRSHCDNKRGTRAKNFDCDIDKINWRTGEPIGYNMGLQNDIEGTGEDFPADQSCKDGFASDQNNDAGAGEHNKSDFCPSDASSWHEAPNASPRCRRRSLSSECSVDSEDSFIVFHSGAPSDSSSDLGDWSDCDTDDSFESDTEASEEDDVCDGFYPSSRRLKEVNDLWQREYTAELDSSSSNVESNDSKKVHFSNSRPTVHKMLAWDFAYRNSRPGPWEQMARDRDRFKTRIRQFEVILSPVLTSDHRNKIWNRINNSQVQASS